MTVRTGFGLIGMLGQFDGEEGPRRVQEFEQATDQTFRDLRQEISGLETTVNQSIEQNTTEITGIATDNSELDTRLTVVEEKVTALEAVAALWRGHFQLGQSVAAGFQFLMTQDETSGNISFNGTTAVTINEAGLYTVLWSFYGTRNSTAATALLPVSLRVNAVTIATAASVRYTTDSSATGASNGAVSMRLSQGDVIYFSSGSSSLTPTIAENRQTVSIAKVGE